MIGLETALCIGLAAVAGRAAEPCRLLAALGDPPGGDHRRVPVAGETVP